MSTVSKLQTTQVAEAFDSVAEIFEDSLENEITRGLRQRTYSLIRSLVPAGASVLDINCGIGIDAVALSQEGYRVIGVDISPKMIQQALERANKLRVKNVEFLLASFDDLSSFTGKTFDLVLSNFGGLNCVEDLDAFAKQAVLVTKPGGYFVGVVMPPVCLWEVISGLARLNLRTAFRRLKKNVPATGFRGKTFWVHYHSPRSFSSLFKPWFKSQGLCALNLITPPPHALAFAKRHSRLTKFLETVEPALRSLPLLRSIGDHYLIVLKKE